MKRRFKTGNKINTKIIFYVILLGVSFLSTLNLLFGSTSETKSYLLSTLVNESVRKESKVLTDVVDTLSTPKYMIYNGLNKIVEKNNLSVFSSLEDDGFDYTNPKSDYVVDPNPTKPNEPIVYIYNTHQLEEYSSIMPYEYSVKPNVMIASYIMREQLGNLGIQSVVETNNIKEYLSASDMSFNKSYLASEYFARKAEEEYPSIKYLIDIHRDSASYDITYKEIDGKSYARVLLVTGMEHTLPENNIGFAEEIEEILERDYPGLSRGILRKNGTPIYATYNQNLFGKSVLFEVGGEENKIEEVNNTMEVLAKVLSEIIGREQ